MADRRLLAPSVAAEEHECQVVKRSGNYKIVLEFMRMLSLIGLPWQHACRRGLPSGCHGNALPSVMKPVANLDKDFARIQIVCSAEGEAVVEQDAAVGYVDSLQIG
jgi:hypothetical protein